MIIFSIVFFVIILALMGKIVYNRITENKEYLKIVDEEYEKDKK